MMAKLYAWMMSNDGVTGIEYGLIVGGISAAMAGAALVFGDQLMTMFNENFMVLEPNRLN